jgi:hypothetical protein
MVEKTGVRDQEIGVRDQGRLLFAKSGIGRKRNKKQDFQHPGLVDG